MDSKKNKLNLEKFSEISGLFHPYNHSYLADDSLTDVDVLLLSIFVIEKISEKNGAKYEEAKELFISLGRKEDSFRKILHKIKKDSLIKEDKRLLYFLIKGLKKLQKIIGQTGKEPVYIIKSGQNFTAIKLFEDFLVSEMKSDEILLCDSYISPSTLHPFSTLKGKLKNLKILTTNVFEHDKLKDYVANFKKELNVNIEVRKTTKIHDRYIINGESAWSIGSSIKDLGNKDTLIKDLVEVHASLKDLFMERWNESSKI
ncbi:hypothetical protein J4466_05580 [Candidatus Pacearchaeota archaeon]|nr:hypothetical protein [Candidatus Pacearchaeota archaeon]